MKALLRRLWQRDRATYGTLIRFVIVGVIATLTYLVVSVGLSGSPVGWPEWIASAIAFAVSIPVSYLGHLHFTYALEPDHAHHGPRFFVVTVVLAATLSIVSQVMYSMFGAGHVWSNVIVAVLFPPASFVAHTLWSFSSPKRVG